MSEYKQCSKCHRLKLAADFYAGRGACKPCELERNAAYRAANKEKKAAYNAAYRAANKEKRAIQKAAYHAANKEKAAAYQAAYRSGKYVTRRARLFFQTFSALNKMKNQTA